MTNKAQNLEIRKDGLKYRRIKSNSILPSNTNWLEFNLTRCWFQTFDLYFAFTTSKELKNPYFNAFRISNQFSLTLFYRSISISRWNCLTLPSTKVDKILAFKYSNPFSFEHLVHDKKKRKKKEHQALASAFFDDLSKSLGPFSLYLLLAPFSLLFYRILICIASHRLAAGFIRTRGKYGGINVGHLVWKKKEKGGWKAGRR